MSVDSLESWSRLKAVPCDQFQKFEEIFAPAPASFGPFVNGESLRLYADDSVGITQVVVQLGIDAGAWTNPWSHQRIYCIHG